MNKQPYPKCRVDDKTVLAARGPPISKVMKCIFIKENKMRCEANPMLKSKYCYYHNPEISQEEKLEAQIKGGMANKIMVRDPLPVIPLKSTKDVVVLLEDTISRVRDGSLELKIANTIGFLTGHLLRAFEVSELESRMETIERVILEKKTTRR